MSYKLFNSSDTALVLKLDHFLYDHGLRSQIRCCETHRKSCIFHHKSVSKVNTNIVLIALRCLTELHFEIAKQKVGSCKNSLFGMLGRDG